MFDHLFTEGWTSPNVGHEFDRTPRWCGNSQECKVQSVIWLNTDGNKYTNKMICDSKKGIKIQAKVSSFYDLKPVVKCINNNV